MTCVLYARVSTKTKGQDTDNQLIELRRFAGARGLSIVIEYEEHVSGSGKVTRPQFERMMEDARQKKFDVLLFWALDRLTREGALKTIDYLQRLDTFGVAWVSYTEQYLDSLGVFKDAVLAILAVIAKQERTRLVERTKAGIARARIKGTKSGLPIGRPRAVFSRDRVLALSTQGLSIRAIAGKLGVSHGSVQRTLKP
jgi:DNA invertase Pin-like site-specific DNA recombinase